MTPREIEQLGVESKPFNALLCEKDLAALATEGFEAALCVHKGKSKDNAHDRVEDDASDFAETRFMNADETAIEGAGTDGYVIGLQGVDKFGSFFDRCG
jgi:hypothetical protein